jgi:hypothetical protein
LCVYVCVSRFQTFKLQDRFEGVDGVLSYGPCQFPTLGFVVERYKRIQNFVVRAGGRCLRRTRRHARPAGQPASLPMACVCVCVCVCVLVLCTPLCMQPEDFWSIRMEHGVEGSSKGTVFSWARNRLFDRYATLVLYSMVVQAGTADVLDVRTR